MNSIDYQFYLHAITRERIQEIIESFDEKALNKIKNGFKNNMIWNAAHVVVTQHLLTYGLAGLPLNLPDEIVSTYRKGAAPNGNIGTDSIDEIKQLLLSTPAKLKADYNAGVFEEFKPYETSYGVELKNIEQAIVFNNTHEGLHLGYIMAMRKLF